MSAHTRPPIVAIMGHIDHGKSTLLAYIRKSKKPLAEAGGITQHISAYEIEHVGENGQGRHVTFLDTPGHAAFCGIRERGARVADIAVLVVSAEDGVKPQTKEALSLIIESGTPYIVAINKIDKEGANIEKTKQSLAENEIYIEGYGGDIPVVALSAKTGQGVSELLDMILLLYDLSPATSDPNSLATGVIIESNRDVKKGLSAVCLITSGTLRKGNFLQSGNAVSPVRIMENFENNMLEQAGASSPVRVYGWNKLPRVGATFHTYTNKETAEASAEDSPEDVLTDTCEVFPESVYKVPLILKADTSSTLEAMVSEIRKARKEMIVPYIIAVGIGPINENDIALSQGKEKAFVVGLGVKADKETQHLAERHEVSIHLFDIIYKMTEWLEEVLIEKTPKTTVEESTGRAKVLKVFSKVKDKQIIGGSVSTGTIKVGAQVKLLRREIEIDKGKIRELQSQKVRTQEISEGKEFGALIDMKMEIAPGDVLESFITLEK